MTRKTSELARRAALAANLKEMFRVLARRPVPDTIASVVEQLDDEASETPRKTGRGKA